jgi:transposase
MTPLEQVRALVLARSVLDRELEHAVQSALVAGERATALAAVLGISRSSVYRQFDVRSEEGTG